jgi:tripartite-type tricarboxylate transporter receptor subunit TctC
MRALAISSTQRNPQLPDVPTFAELGYPEVEDYTWVGFFAPAGTPPDVVAKLNEAINNALRDKEVREKLEALTFEPVGGTPQEFAAYVRKEVAHWAGVIKQTGAKVD